MFLGPHITEICRFEFKLDFATFQLNRALFFSANLNAVSDIRHSLKSIFQNLELFSQSLT